VCVWVCVWVMGVARGTTMVRVRGLWWGFCPELRGAMCEVQARSSRVEPGTPSVGGRLVVRQVAPGGRRCAAAGAAGLAGGGTHRAFGIWLLRRLHLWWLVVADCGLVCPIVAQQSQFVSNLGKSGLRRGARTRRVAALLAPSTAEATAAAVHERSRRARPQRSSPWVGIVVLLCGVVYF
jgi:hypothetical protein